MNCMCFRRRIARLHELKNYRWVMCYICRTGGFYFVGAEVIGREGGGE